MIYALVNTETGEARYVGRTSKSAQARLANHRCEVHEDTPKDQWMKSIGLENVGIVVLEQNPNDPDAAELWWMDYLEFLGCDLTNVIREPIGGRKGNSGVEVTSEMKEMMGNVPDQQVANKFEISQSVVVKHRKRLGIDAYGNNGGLNVPQGCLDKLGKIPDRELARKYDVNRGTLYDRRKELGIEPVQSYDIDLPQECLDQLGERSDRQLAQEYGVSASTIARRRKEREIDAYC